MKHLYTTVGCPYIRGQGKTDNYIMICIFISCMCHKSLHSLPLRQYCFAVDYSVSESSLLLRSF